MVHCQLSINICSYIQLTAILNLLCTMYWLYTEGLRLAEGVGAGVGGGKQGASQG